ncbi:transmembrane protein 68-like [Galendromus occidentalis]|uniref:Transmembrane protein 68-like n=1 Tax=Galendromus occidentalis TaxID=34638 RepID=A0AAJ6VYC7_9ACAR|nr:transmembrane protein 68-like [Galendromus occidentalis]
MFSKNYKVEWQSRCGFARVAKETGVPIVPMFTANIQHSMPLYEFNKSETVKKWYAATRIPLSIPMAYFPVKLRTYLGKPMYCEPDEEPESFALRCKKAIEDLRDEHQPPQQTVWSAVRERFS